MPAEYVVNLQIRIPDDETKKDTVVSNIITQLEAARAAGNINSAKGSIYREVVPETWELAPL